MRKVRGSVNPTTDRAGAGILSLIEAQVDISERAATQAADERAEAIARRTADLVGDLPIAKRRRGKLEALLRPFADCAALLPLP